MKRRSLFILILFTIPCTTASSSKSPEQQEEEVTKILGTCHIAENWSDKFRGERVRSVVYQVLAKKRKEEIGDLNKQKQALHAELNQEQINHAQTREQVAVASTKLKEKDERIVELHIAIKDLNKINERLIQEQSDYGH